ncbi:MAG TPA: hypothetical protein ACFCUD_03555 [Cyclobacteriaceae bacterium]
MPLKINPISYCPTKKNCYHNEHEALEALINAKITSQHAVNYGAINFYKCDFCDAYHLTSKGVINPSLNDQSVIKRIQRGRQAKYWEQKFR